MYRPHRQRAAMLFGSLAVVLAMASCKSKTKDAAETQPLEMADTSSSGERFAIEQPCPAALEVLKPAANSLEQTVQKVLAAATAEGDDNANFDKFYAEFKTTTPKSALKSFLWKNAKKHAKKYLIPGKEKDVGFTICRRVPGSGGKTKIFLRSYSEKQNTPMTLKQVEDGSYKVTSYSP